MNRQLMMFAIAALASVAFVACDEDGRTPGGAAGVSDLTDREFCQQVVDDYNRNRDAFSQAPLYLNGINEDGSCDAGQADIEGDGR